MNPNAKKILNARVVRVENFQELTIRLDDVETRQWTADFQLWGGQGFHVRCNSDGYLYTPIVGQNKLTDLKQIFWKEYQMGFGGRGCGLITEVQSVPQANKETKEAYEQILTPTVIETGRWEPYPSYRYVPMLVTAFKIRHAWQKKEKMARKLKMASQNLKDILALREATYDMEYE